MREAINCIQKVSSSSTLVQISPSKNNQKASEDISVSTGLLVDQENSIGLEGAKSDITKTSKTEQEPTNLIELSSLILDQSSLTKETEAVPNRIGPISQREMAKLIGTYVNKFAKLPLDTPSRQFINGKPYNIRCIEKGRVGQPSKWVADPIESEP